MERSPETLAGVMTPAAVVDLDVMDANLTRMADKTGWRVAFKASSQGSTPMDMRLHIALGDQQLSEVWSYVWYPDDIR